jgi:hypothetical protein
MDDILSEIKSQAKMNYKIRGKKIMEGDYSSLLSEVDPPPPWATQGTKDKTSERDKEDERENERKDREDVRKQKEFEYKKERDKAKDTADKEKERKEEEDAKKAEAAGKQSAKATVTDLKSVSLEPSNIKVSNKDGTESIIGIKVVPIRVKSDAKLSHLLINDLSLGFIRTSLISVGRNVMRWFYKKVLRSRDIDVATGDPRKDMFMARTGLKGNAFIVLNKDEDLDSVLFSQPKKIQKLFGLSWGNMIIADDINRVSYFCMKKFKGLCSMIPYSMIYQQLGQTQIYNDLEDVRQKSGAVFKRRPTRMKKVFAEQLTQIKISDYQTLSEDSNNE